jgi:hypothetical protein
MAPNGGWSAEHGFAVLKSPARPVQHMQGDVSFQDMSIRKGNFMIKRAIVTTGHDQAHMEGKPSF